MECFPSVNSEPLCSVKREVDDEVDADERLDHVPLMKRVKTLLLARGLSTSSSLRKPVGKREEHGLKDTLFDNAANIRRSIIACDNRGRKERAHSVDDKISQKQCAAEVPANTVAGHTCAAETSLKVHAIDSARCTSLPENILNGFAIGLKEVVANAHNAQQLSTLSSFPITVKVENCNNCPTNPCKYDMISTCNADKQPVKVKSEMPNDFEIDLLDHISLQERRRLQLSSCHSSGFMKDSKCSETRVTRAREFDLCNSLNSKASSITLGGETGGTSLCSLEMTTGEDRCVLQQEASLGDSSYRMKDINLPCIENVEEENLAADREFMFKESCADSINKTNADKLFGTSTSSAVRFIESNSVGSSSAITHSSPKISKCPDNALAALSNLQEIQGAESMCSHLTSLPDVKAPNDYMRLLALTSFPMQVKVESLEDGLMGPSDDHRGNLIRADKLSYMVKSEILGEFFTDEIDHIPLQERFNMLVSGSSFRLDYSHDLNYIKQIVPSTLECAPVGSVDVKKGRATARQKRKKIITNTKEVEHVPGGPETVPIDSVKERRFTLRRKKKKTATDSVETALEEDAPGLLQVLVNKGINVDEIKLYGDAEDADALDVSSCEDGFSELESVISKLFFQPSTLLKSALVRHTKGSKANYCLACLVSLIEQSRYLHFKKWPAEWGWCRDLQSFIFVFERHNRIVLERPEYGYATYFFELVGSLPISWQIKRLVTAMKLTSCSRATLIENKALLVGEDLTEGEAQVLEEYGWTPNSGLGTMLRYCDRVVHDRKSEVEKSESEWRSKIGRLLMNGYDGGSVVLPILPKRVIEYNGYQSPQIKLEV
ncbi:hypothetical protein AAC387_Pa09g2409 [Persea americana]